MRDEDKYIITNPVLTPEEMADYLGVSRERLAELRRIMDSPGAAASKSGEEGTEIRQTREPVQNHEHWPDLARKG